MRRTGLALVAAFTLGASSTPTFADDWPDPGAYCRDTSDVVGYRSCRGYAPWGMEPDHPYMFIDVGVNVRYLPRRLAPADGLARAVSPLPNPLGAMPEASVSFQERIAVVLARVLYLGAEVELADLARRATPDPGSRHLVIGGLGIAGLRADLRFLMLGVEIAGGGRMVDTERANAASITTGEYVAEVRARADLWLGPWVTVGAALGTSLLDREEWMMGAYVGFHTHSFGGQR